MQMHDTDTTEAIVSLADARAQLAAHPMRLATSTALSLFSAPGYLAQLAEHGLDWTVTKVPLRGPDGRTWPGAYGVRRDDTGAPLGVVGARYQPLQNGQLAEALEVTFGHLPPQLRPRVENAGALGGGSGLGDRGSDRGARVFAQLALPEQLSNLVRVPRDRDSATRALLSLLNRHDGAGSAVVGASTTRVVCRNTYDMASGEARSARGLVLRHTFGRTGPDAYREQVNKWLKRVGEGYAAMGERMRAWSERPVTVAQAESIVSEVLAGEVLAPERQTAPHKRAVAAIIEMVDDRDGVFVPRGDVTRYSLFQAVTAYEMHRRPARGALPAQAETRLWRVLDSDSDALGRVAAVLDRAA